jgi:hypothetical protein
MSEEQSDSGEIATKVIQTLEDSMGNKLPQMNVNMQAPKKDEEIVLIKNEQMIALYNEILDNCREDRKDADSAFKTFLDMVVNDGDPSSSSKEAMVQLLRVRIESTDKMTKVMDLLMRAVLKEKDSFPKYMNAHQENHVTIKTKASKRDFLEKLQKSKKDDLIS